MVGTTQDKEGAFAAATHTAVDCPHGRDCKVCFPPEAVAQHANAGTVDIMCAGNDAGPCIAGPRKRPFKLRGTRGQVIAWLAHFGEVGYRCKCGGEFFSPKLTTEIKAVALQSMTPKAGEIEAPEETEGAEWATEPVIEEPTTGGKTGEEILALLLGKDTVTREEEPEEKTDDGSAFIEMDLQGPATEVEVDEPEGDDDDIDPFLRKTRLLSRVTHQTR